MSCCGCLPFRSPMSRQARSPRLQQRRLQASRSPPPLPPSAQQPRPHRHLHGASTTVQLSLMELQQLSSLPASPRTAVSPRPPLPASPPALQSPVPMTRLSVPMKLMPPALPSSPPPRLHHMQDVLQVNSEDGGREGQQQWQPHYQLQPVQHQPVVPPRAALPAPIIIQVRTPVPEDGDAGGQQELQQQQQSEQWEDEEDEDDYGSEDDSPYLEMYEGEELTMELQPRAALPGPSLLDPRLAAMGKAAAAMYAFYNSDQQQQQQQQQQQPQTAARKPEISADPTSASSPSPQQQSASRSNSHRSRPRSHTTSSSSKALRARQSRLAVAAAAAAAAAASGVGLPPPVPPRPRQSLSVQ